MVLPQLLGPLKWKPPPSAPANSRRGPAAAHEILNNTRLLPELQAAMVLFQSSSVPAQAEEGRSIESDWNTIFSLSIAPIVLL